MSNIKTLAKIEGKKVLLRTNYDVPLRFSSTPLTAGAQGKPIIVDNTRIIESLPTINYLLEQKAKQIVIISHLGRPEGKIVPELSLRPVAEELERLLGKKVALVSQVDQVVMLENLRFNSGEEANDPDFAKKLASLGDFFVNEAFAASHREHASIVGVPKFFPPERRALGFEFLKEIEALTRVREKPARPLVLLLGGGKGDKLESLAGLAEWADQVLIGGRLPSLVSKFKVISSKFRVASLNPEAKDITPETVAEFKKIIAKAKTIVWAGPMGNFYDEKYATGTKEIAEAVTQSLAFTVVGGGDTEAALTKFGLTEKIGFISSGGGAMLEFLSEGDLPGLRAIC